MKNNILILKNLYILLFILIVAVIVFHPLILENNLPALSHESEEILEVVLSILLFGLGYFIYILYEREAVKKDGEMIKCNYQKTGLEKKLDDAFKYIGQINVQISEIRSMFSDVKKYPVNKKDLKYSLEFLANKVLGIINADWVALRVIDLNNLATLTEYNLARNKSVKVKQNISNKELADNNGRGVAVVTSEQNNLFIKAFCVLPEMEVSREQKVFIKAICSQLELFYVIFSSNYYKNSRENRDF